MSRQEFQAWREYYHLFPFDDLHRYHRPAALISHSASGGGGSDLLEQRLNWLQPDPGSMSGLYTDADMATFRAFGMKPPGRG